MASALLPLNKRLCARFEYTHTALGSSASACNKDRSESSEFFSVLCAWKCGRTKNRTDSSVRYAKKATMAKLATEDRTAETRKQVLQAAIEVFAAEGYYEADVQVIADRAGVGKGTVYRHFGDKEKLFRAAARHALEQMSESIGQEIHPGQSAVVYLRNIAVGCARYYTAHPEALELIVQERAAFRKSATPTHRLRHSEGRHVVEEELRRGIESGELRPIDVRATFEAFGDLLFGCIFNSVVTGKPSSLVPRVQHAMDIFFEGIMGVSGPTGSCRTPPRRAKGGL